MSVKTKDLVVGKSYKYKDKDYGELIEKTIVNNARMHHDPQYKLVFVNRTTNTFATHTFDWQETFVDITIGGRKHTNKRRKSKRHTLRKKRKFSSRRRK